MTRGGEIMATIEKHAPTGYEPSTDDMTVPFAIKLAEQDAEIERLRAALKPFSDAALDVIDGCSDRSDIWESPAAMNITAGQLRHARSVYEQTATAGES